MQENSHVWAISELYYPETTSTGFFMTGIIEGLARTSKAKVLCSQPTYSARGTRAPKHEIHNGVEIWRCAGTTLNNKNLLFRLINGITMSASMFFAALFRFQRGDRVLVVTNPMFLPYAMRVACALRGARCFLLVHDVYPELPITAGLFSERSLISRVVGFAASRMYRSMERVIVLGRDMKRLIRKRMGTDKVPIDVIQNWGEVDTVRPLPRSENRLLQSLGLADKFVIQYSGNMGRTHGLETMIEAARRLENEDCHFLFIGSGAKRDYVEEQAKTLKNVTVLPPRPFSELADSLNAADLAVISFIPGMAGISVPSRMYNVLAAGRPLLAVADADSELAEVVREEEAGWVVAPNDVEGVVEAIRAARANPDELRRRGENGRRAAVQKYSYAEIIKAFEVAMNR